MRELEPISFVVAVDDWQEVHFNLQASPVFASARHEWILVDNVGNQRYESLSRLYAEAAQTARHDLQFFVHQDVYLPAEWEQQVADALSRLGEGWGVVGPVGVTLDAAGSRAAVGSWQDPWGRYHTVPLPHAVQSLDEMCLGLRRSRGVEFDPDLAGFHCYGTDIVLAAREAGLPSYAIDAGVRHKWRDGHGRIIARPEESARIRARRTPEFLASYDRAAQYVRAKWAHHLPFSGTSYQWT